MPDDLAAARGNIDTSLYGGYLAPWIDIIVNLHFGGLNSSEIAKEITPVVRAKYNGGHYDPTPGAVEYILKRIGCKRYAEKTPACAEGSETARPNREDRSRYAVSLRDQGFTLSEIGKRLGRTKEIARQVLLQHQYAEHRRARIERMDRIIEEWLAEQDPNERRQQINKGRPLDMGGPRDVWIERDQWSDL